MKRPIRKCSSRKLHDQFVKEMPLRFLDNRKPFGGFLDTENIFWTKTQCYFEYIWYCQKVNLSLYWSILLLGQVGLEFVYIFYWKLDLSHIGHLRSIRCHFFVEGILLTLISTLQFVKVFQNFQFWKCFLFPPLIWSFSDLWFQLFRLWRLPLSLKVYLVFQLTLDQKRLLFEIWSYSYSRWFYTSDHIPLNLFHLEWKL